MIDNRLKILPYNKYGALGVDLAVYSEEATVGDYCRAIEDYILCGSYERKRAQPGTCEGCDICCHERIPLTSIDVLGLKEQVASSLGLVLDLADIFQRFTYIAVSGRVVDISLSRQQDESCIFLNNETKKCLQYEKRPFVCRTYLCTNSSGRLAGLRDSIVNSGEDELVRMWLLTAKDNGYIMHEASEPAVSTADWPENVWTGKRSFAEVVIKEIVSPSLWADLFEIDPI